MPHRQNYYYYDIVYIVPGLLMRPEHGETKAKTETRECKTKTETETKKLLWDRDQKLRDRDWDHYDQFNCMWK